MERVQVAIPPGMRAGQQLQFTTPSGQTCRATIPPGVPPGGTFIVEVQARPVQALPMLCRLDKAFPRDACKCMPRKARAANGSRPTNPKY